MIVAAHQPNYLPWLGYFDRIRRAQLFILLDHVQFERQNFQNRTKIKAAGAPRWITVPVHQKSRGELILEKLVCNGADEREHWGRKTYLLLEQNYAKAPHFKDYAPGLKEIYVVRRWEKLIDLNIALLKFCLDALSIKTPLIRSSELKVSGAKSELVLNMCLAAKAKSYIAGMGASRHYLDLEAFKRSGVDVVWQEFKHPPYPQAPSGSPHVPGLSVLDLLFNCGPRSAEVLASGGQCPA